MGQSALTTRVMGRPISSIIHDFLSYAGNLRDCPHLVGKKVRRRRRPHTMAPSKSGSGSSASSPALAQGRGTKRTPQSAFDAAAGKDVYEPENIVAQRIAKGGVTHVPREVGWLRSGLAKCVRLARTRLIII